MTEIERLKKIIRDIGMHPDLPLGDMIYTVRERNGGDWNHPAVKAWSDAVAAVDAENKVT